MKFKLFFIILAIFAVTNALDSTTGTSQTTQPEFQSLKGQQKQLQDKINALIQKVITIQGKVSKTTNSSEKVLLLQDAIVSQRQQIFQIRNLIIPPFNLSKTACLQLTNQQKIDLLDQIDVSKKSLQTLKKDLSAVKKCDKVDALNKDLQKQLILLHSLQNTIYTECATKSILSPTIYQTNVYSNNWILGQQTIDDLIEQYYQRNIRYKNITNCPLQKPFFDGQNCINCSTTKPVFNIFTRQCTVCEKDQQVDSNTRKCAWKPHFTNFTLVQNWAQDGAPMPIYERNILPCPQNSPYYNGKTCEKCELPKYWSIKKNACSQCPSQQLFDGNDKKCENPQSWELTLLQNTNWVTNDCNLTRVLQQRVKVLKLNETKKYYKYCPKQKPYFDKIKCVSCPNQFNIDTLKCVQASSSDYKFNQNMRCYTKKQTGKQTDPLAANYTTKSPLTDSIASNCNKTNPYFDGISCIYCQKPFQIFNADTKKCSQCQKAQIYNNKTHKCDKRTVIYISNRTTGLMATKDKTINAYNQQIAKKIDSNPQAIFQMCQTTQYSNFTNCIQCKKQEYFNVQTKKCDICDGTLSASKVCQHKIYTYCNITNSSYPRIVDINSTQEQEAKNIQNLLKMHPDSKVCAADKPYFDGTNCTNCTKQSFNYSSLKCVPFVCQDPSLPFYNSTTDKCTGCPDDMQYSQLQKKCVKIQYVTNTNAIFYYIQQGNYTKKNLQAQNLGLQDKFMVRSCDSKHPYWNGTACIDCSITRNQNDLSNFKPYFNIKSQKCESCNKYNSTTYACEDPKIACPKEKPYLNPKTSVCQICPSPSVYNAATASCIATVTNTNQMGSYIQSGNFTKANLQKNISSLGKVSEIKYCPKETPYYKWSSNQCIKCVTPSIYFNLATQLCESCATYDNTTKTCSQAVNPVEPVQPAQMPRDTTTIEDMFSAIF